MKLKKLDVRGFSHDIIIVMFVVIFALGGVGYLVASHADNCSTAVSGDVSGAASEAASSDVSGDVSGDTTCLTPTSSVVSTPVSTPTYYVTAPQSLTSSNITTSSFTISYKAGSSNAGAIAGYYIYLYKISAGSSTATTVKTSATSYSFSNLAPSTAYAVYIKDYAGNYTSAPSSTLSITTLTPAVTPPTPYSLNIAPSSLTYTHAGVTNNAPYATIYWTASGSGKFTLAKPTAQLVVTAKGDQCQGPPQMGLAIDGKALPTQNVTATTYKAYASADTLSAGAHTIKLSFLNDFNKPRVCDRNLYVQNIQLKS